MKQTEKYFGKLEHTDVNLGKQSAESVWQVFSRTDRHKIEHSWEVGAAKERKIGKL